MEGSKPQFEIGFWRELTRPFSCLAPMADVTDRVFRQIIVRYSKPAGPDVMWTEFVSADGLAHPQGREKLIADLQYTEKERPIVAQIFGSNIKNIESSAKLCAKMGFDGIDINMGCPHKIIEKQGAGCGHIKDKEHATEIIRAAKRGAGDIPVSVKTRLGYNKNEIEDWIPTLLREGVAALTIHLRTRKEMSQVPAHWEIMPRIIEMRDEIAPQTLIIGNGDVMTPVQGLELCKKYGCDGTMIGRGIFGTPWLWSEKSKSLAEKLKIMIEHTKLYEKLLPEKNFAIMKKHYKAYVNEFNGAKELRIKLMNARNAAEIEELTKIFIKGLHE